MVKLKYEPNVPISKIGQLFIPELMECHLIVMDLYLEHSGDRQRGRVAIGDRTFFAESLFY